MSMDQIRALLSCMENKHRALSLFEEGGMGMDPIRGFTGVYGEEAYGVVSVRGGWPSCMSMDQIRGFTSVHGEEAISLARARRVV